MPSFRPMAIANRMMPASNAMPLMNITTCAISRSIDDCVVEVAVASPAMQPMNVLSPVRTTTPLASPDMTSEELNTRLRDSANRSDLRLTTHSIASDSPVSEDISTFKSATVMRMRSAGTRLPMVRWTMSPITSCSTPMWNSFPSRTTAQFLGSIPAMEAITSDVDRSCM